MTGQTRQQGAFFVLLLTVFIDMVGFGIIIPFMPFWAEHFDASPAVVTLLFSTYSAVAFFFSFFWGWVSDRWGRKPVLLLSLFGSVMSFAWLGFADALWMLFAARALGGVFGANIPVAQAYVADVTEPEKRAQGMGMIGAAFGLGFVLGPAIGGLLAGPDAANPDFRTPFFVASGVSFVGVVFGLIFLPEPARRSEQRMPTSIVERFKCFAVVIGHPLVALPIMVVLMMAFVMGGLESTLALWTERVRGWGPRENGYFFAYIGVLLVIIQGGLVRVFANRLGETRTVPVAVAVMAVGIGMIPLVQHAVSDPSQRRSYFIRVRTGQSDGQQSDFAQHPGRHSRRRPRRVAVGSKPVPDLRAGHRRYSVRGFQPRHALLRGRDHLDCGRCGRLDERGPSPGAARDGVMGLYSRYVVPPLIHMAMKNREATRLRRRVVPAAEGRVLEIGIGSGLNLPFYGDAVTAVVGIDPSPPLLDRARKAGQNVAVDLDVVDGSAEALPFDADDFDTVLTTWTVCSIPDAAAALAEMRRVLKPSGALLFIEHGRAPDAAVRGWQDRLNPAWHVVSGGCNMNRDIPGLMAGAGLRVTQEETGYLIKGPRIFTYTYMGRAASA